MDLNVAIKLRITPDDVDADLDLIKEKLEEITSEYGKVNQSEEKPLAFGLKALEALVLLDDSTGGMDEIQDKLKEFKDVSQVEVIDMDRL